MNTEESYAEDLRVVNDHMRQIAVRAATSALADAIRAQGGLGAEVSLLGPLAASTTLAPRHEPALEPVTVYPIPAAARPTRWRWGVIEWCVLATILAVGATAILAIMALARALIDAVGMAGHAAAGLISGLTGVAGLVALTILTALLFGRGGDGSFSGAFSGRMH